jgi:hypothetical protein
MQFRNLTIAASLAFTAFILPAAAMAGYEGAIAFSQRTGASGWSKNYDTKREASDAALSYCNANDCKVVYNFTNACAALAAGPDGGYGVDWDVKKGRAERKALRACEGYTSGCQIVISACSKNQ